MLKTRFCLLLSLWLLSFTAARAAFPAPKLLLLDPTALAAYRTAYQAKSPAETTAVQQLLAEADKALRRGPYDIATKPQVPPSGDKHDYISQAPYWWADPSKPNGRPYVQKDGLRNPESAAMMDAQQLSKMSKDVRTLALAYYFSGQEKYAAHAARLLQVFFLDEATRMNPNLNFGQGIPGTADGRSYGIIETRGLVGIPDALALLGGSASRTPALTTGVQEWFKQYTSWLLTSQIGREEGTNKNNHGTFADVQVVDYSLFIGDTATARRILRTRTLPRLGVQLDADGGQPLELARTRPWNYVSMNMQGWVSLALLGEHLGLDLWHYATPNGRSLRTAVAWFRPYLMHEKQMDRADVAATSDNAALSIYDRATRPYPELNTAAVFAQYPAYARTPWAFDTAH